ncbi:MAG: DUF4158 domain-containing protein [Pseudonocardiaceae bacterium]
MLRPGGGWVGLGEFADHGPPVTLGAGHGPCGEVGEAGLPGVVAGLADQDHAGFPLGLGVWIVGMTGRWWATSPAPPGWGLLLKFFELEARFPKGADELPAQAVAYVDEQVQVDVAAYPWSGRSIKYHREQIRAAFGFREFTRGDEDKLAGWLAEEVCPVELRDQQLHDALLVRCRAERIEPPGRAERIIASARAMFELRFCDRTVSRLSPASVDALEDLVAEQSGASARALLAELKADPGPVGLETLLREIDKLAAVRALALPQGLFAGASEKLVEAWRARAARSYPSDLRSAPRAVRLTLLAALCVLRSAEITDALVELLIGLIHKINTRADRRVERELTEDLRRVRGKEAILFRLAEAAVEHPDDTVRAVLFPVVGRRPCVNWSARPRPTNAPSKPGSGPCCARRTPTTTAGCCRRCWRRCRSAATHRLPAGDECTGSCWPTTPDAMGRPATSPTPTRHRSTRWCRERGATRSSMTGAGSSASPTSCACWSRWAMRCAAGRSTSTARTAGATPTMTCPAISTPPGRCITPRSANPPTRPRSSPTCGNG